MSAPQPIDDDFPSFLSGGGEMGRRIREHDWAQSPLGPPASWPAALATLVSVILGSNQSMFICWGPQRITLYNDGYADLLGMKHPAALGRDLLDIWAEIRDELKGLVDQVYRGIPVHMDDIMFMLDRHGYLEESHFAFSYTPIPDGNNQVGGMLCPCRETTEQVLTKRRMAEENERQRRLSEQAPGFMATLSGPDHVFDFTNRAFVTLFGERDHRGRKVREVYPELGEQGFIKVLDEVYRSGRRRSFYDTPVRLINVPGAPAQTFYLNFIYEPILDEAGRATGIFIQGYDVSDTFRTQAALRASEQSFSALAQALPTMVWTADAAGLVDWMNERTYAYGGIPSSVKPDEAWRSMVHPEDLQMVLATWDTSLSTGSPLTCELRMRRQDGEYRWHLARSVPVRNETDSISRWLGTTTDIADQKQAAEALSKRNSRLQQRVAQRTLERDRVWRNSRDLLAVVDQQGHYRSANPAWHHVLGYHPEEVEGRHFADLVCPEDADTTRLVMAQAFEANLTSFETRHLHRDGSTRWVSWHTTAEGDFCYAYGRDITAAKQQAQALREAEEQLRQAQKMEAVGQLTGGIAHDFNNLLTGIIGALEIMSTRVEQGRPETIGRYARAAMQSAQRAAALTHRLLAFARRQPLTPAPVETDALVQGMRELIQRTLGPQFRLQLHSEAGLWPTLCDPYQLESAILNICINARDAMPDGGLLSIELSNTRREEPWPPGESTTRFADFVAIRITDTGCGMAPELIERVIEPFFTTKPLGQGTGLGLSMVYGFAKQSEGHMEISSTLGNGTTITLFLPRLQGVAPQEITLQTAPEPRHRACATVLVVEDEHLIRELLIETLRELGCVVMHANDGIAGRRQLRASSHIDLLITDIGLPGLDGRQLAAEALEQHPGLRVLYITGYSQEPSFASALEAGERELITKPFLVTALKARVIRLLEGS